MGAVVGKTKGAWYNPPMEPKLPPEYTEDAFDLDLERTKRINAVRSRRHFEADVKSANRIIFLGRIVIVVMAFVVSFWLYTMIDGAIEQYQYRRYHSAPD